MKFDTEDPFMKNEPEYELSKTLDETESKNSIEKLVRNNKCIKIPGLNNAKQWLVKSDFGYYNIFRYFSDSMLGGYMPRDGVKLDYFDILSGGSWKVVSETARSQNF